MSFNRRATSARRLLLGSLFAPAVLVAALQLASIDSSRSQARVYGWIVAAVLLIIGLGSARLLAPEPPHRDALAPGEDRASSRAPLAAAAQTGSMRDREVLVAACIHVCDVLGRDALSQHLLGALADAGVTAVDVPVETRFDPAQHKAADTLVTDKQTLAGLVAETERLGFVDRGRRVRWPEVLVYQLGSGQADGA